MEKLYLDDPYIRHPGDYRSGLSFVECLEDEKSQNITHLATKFKLYYSVNIRFKTADGCENFGFALNSPRICQHAKLIEELPLIHLFIKKFREEFKPLINAMNESSIDLISILGSEFYQPLEQLSSKKSIDQKLLTEMGIAIPDPLTKREIEIIKEVSRGLSATWIAQHLSISTKTVENHLERIKEKFGCQSKIDLILQVRELDGIGYFD